MCGGEGVPTGRMHIAWAMTIQYREGTPLSDGTANQRTTTKEEQ